MINSLIFSDFKNKMAVAAALMMSGTGIFAMSRASLAAASKDVASLNIELGSVDVSIPELARDASDMAEATRALIGAYGDEMDNGICARVLHKERGEGFWHKIVMHGDASHRMVYYAPGEYVQPHYHDIYEKFTITAGGCHVWLSQDEGQTWVYNYYGIGELLIPGGAWHCLIAGNDGLCMDIWKDVKRTINWLTEDRTSAWSSELEYIVRVEELRDATVSMVGDL